MRKALCEAKVHSSWINPDPDYEAAVARFIDAILDPEQSGEFLADLGHFVERVAVCGRVNSLAQTVIRCTAPGIPDTYQGTECWDFSLVDPDNRRPVDYESRRGWLGELKKVAGNETALAGFSRDLARKMSDPRVKLFTTWRALHCRRQYRDLFWRGDYVPLAVEGPKADHVFAFLRTLDDSAALIAVPRLTAGLATGSNGTGISPEAWESTRICLPEAGAGGDWFGEFDGSSRSIGDSLLAADAFANFSVAILVRRNR
jgi:(1->4)-alpha-D-glucan 1-alpha-D-glucosylmutase